jgi:hypothetical protein
MYFCNFAAIPVLQLPDFQRRREAAIKSVPSKWKQ